MYSDANGLDYKRIPIPPQGDDVKKLRDPESYFKGKIQYSIYQEPPKGSSKSTSWYLSGTCEKWEYVQGHKGSTEVTWGTDIHWCSKAYKRKCTGDLVKVITWKDEVEVTINISGHGKEHGGPGTPGFDDADLFTFGITLAEGQYTELTIKDVTVYHWIKKSHCFQKEGECEDDPCDKVKAPAPTDPPYYTSFSDKYDDVKGVKGIVEWDDSTFPDHKKDGLDTSERPVGLGGDCSTAMGW